jgi:prepilin-type N-terminal cleavage/methylation domain-containing protein
MKHSAQDSDRDAGFTLPELLISVIITGLIAVVIAMTTRGQSQDGPRHDVAG